MRWQQTTFRHASAVTETGFNSQFTNALAALTLPDNVAKPNEHTSDATEDSHRREPLSAYSLALEKIVIDPWNTGKAADNKQNANVWLSSTDALDALKSNLEVTSWEACIVFCVTGANASVLADQLALLLAAFPNQALQKCYRHAKALATHDSDKVFIKAESLNREHATRLDQLSAFSALTTAKQNLSIAEAVSSDSDPVKQLDDFKRRRVERLKAINTALSDLTVSESFSYVLHLSGEYLGDLLASVSAPDKAAPLCCVLAIGGASDAVAPLQEALNL